MNAHDPATYDPSDMKAVENYRGVCDESELRCECLAVIYAALFLLIWSGVIAAVMVVG